MFIRHSVVSRHSGERKSTAGICQTSVRTLSNFMCVIFVHEFPPFYNTGII